MLKMVMVSNKTFPTFWALRPTDNSRTQTFVLWLLSPRGSLLHYAEESEKGVDGKLIPQHYPSSCFFWNSRLLLLLSVCWLCKSLKWIPLSKINYTEGRMRKNGIFTFTVTHSINIKAEGDFLLLWSNFVWGLRIGQDFQVDWSSTDFID